MVTPKGTRGSDVEGSLRLRRRCREEGEADVGRLPPKGETTEYWCRASKWPGGRLWTYADGDRNDNLLSLNQCQL